MNIKLTEKEALDVFDGLMLGDGGLTKWKAGTSFTFGQSKPLCSRAEVTLEVREQSLLEHLEYEFWIRDNILGALGIEACNGHPTICTSTLASGVLYKQAHIETICSHSLDSLYREWYRGGEWSDSVYGYVRGAAKVVPNRLMQASVLPAYTIAPWFLGDGNIGSYSNRRGSMPHVSLSLSTKGFTQLEVEQLTAILNNMGVCTTKPNMDRHIKRGSGLTIRVAQKSINGFMDIVEPYVKEVFKQLDGTKGPLYKRKYLMRTM